MSDLNDALANRILPCGHEILSLSFVGIMTPEAGGFEDGKDVFLKVHLPLNGWRQWLRALTQPDYGTQSQEGNHHPRVETMAASRSWEDGRHTQYLILGSTMDPCT